MNAIRRIIEIWNRSPYPAFVLSIVLTIAFVIQMHRLIADQDWLDHTDRAIGRAILLQKLMLDAETGVRGFLLSGEDVTFNPFREQAAVFDSTLEDAKALVTDNSKQIERLNGIKETFGRWVARANDLHATPAEEQRTFFGVGEGRQLMDICRRHIDAFLATEQNLREARGARLRLEIPRAIISGAAMTLLLRILGVIVLRRLQKKRTA